MTISPLLLPLLFTAIASAATVPVETYEIDARHTFPSIAFPHQGISTWRGKFNRTRGTIVLDRGARSGTVDVEIDADSIDFGLDAMHEHARGERWLDVGNHPAAYYRGTVHFDRDQPARVEGELTLRGATRPLTLTIERFGCVEHPAKVVCGADATGAVRWTDFGLPAMGEYDTATLNLQVEAARDR